VAPKSFDNLLINPNTAKQLEAFLGSPAHGLLLTGLDGVGKYQTARTLSAFLLDTTIEKLDSYPHFLVIQKPDDKKEIPIEAARSLISSLTLKAQGTRIINRVAVIKDAELLSNEAQNALLKILEEPPAGSVIILTAKNGLDLLPTVASRLQKMTILPVSLDQAKEYFATDYNPEQINSAWRLSRGAARLMDEILSDQQAPLKQAVEDAKRLLKLSTYDRLILFEQLSKDKAKLGVTLDGLSRVLAALNRSSAEAGRVNASIKIIKARQLVGRAQDSLSTNANPKLLGLDLVLNLSL
jgi:DNA polymerase III gamma/tau subunit